MASGDARDLSVKSQQIGTHCGEGQTEGATWSAMLQQGLIQC